MPIATGSTGVLNQIASFRFMIPLIALLKRKKEQKIKLLSLSSKER